MQASRNIMSNIRINRIGGLCNVRIKGRSGKRDTNEQKIKNKSEAVLSALLSPRQDTPPVMALKKDFPVSRSDICEFNGS
jgi:hypothetical protein